MSGWGLYVKVAVPRPVDSLFDYEYDEKELGPIKPGDLVTLSFGKSKLNACVVEVSEARPALDEKIKIKKVSGRLSENWSLTEDILKLCQFGAEYYQYALGEAFFVATPPKPEKELGVRARKSKPVKVPFIKDLTQDQAQVVEQMRKTIEQKNDSVFLLQGVTGSGKTEVYIEIARTVLAKNQGVLILVPEIALTAHLRERFENALGEPIALWHSAISDGLRQDQFKKVKSGEVRVVVGARSGIFAPFKELGLIVVDEEHDQTYKQEERFRYHARDLALFRAKYLKIPVILGSATPSLETLQRSREGKNEHLFLKRRFSAHASPELEFVSLIDEPLIIHDEIRTPIAEVTIKRMQESIDRGEQVMVFLNRRGFSQFIMCKDCGWIKKCTNCSISMTHYHKKNELSCHVCGLKIKISETCEECHSHELTGMGSGTEALEEELGLLLRDSKIIRLDRDQITSQKRLEETLDDFRQLKANVMIGTQMLVKGHDFPKVTCVVVMMADMLLKWPDFRASERALQTLIQVSGRSGRADLPGRVMVQGYDLDHPVLKVLRGEVSSDVFIEEELALRKLLFYPPFSRFVRYRFEDADQYQLKKKVEKLALLLSDERLMGPSEALLFRAHNRYRYDLYYKAPSIEALFRMSRKIKKWSNDETLDLLVDVDPYSS